MKSFFLRLVLVGVIFCPLPAWAAGVRVYPAPAGEELSRDYAVEIEGQRAPVYGAKVAPADPAQRWKAMDDKTNSAAYFTQASFAYFDMQGAVTIKVTCRELIQSARVLPSSFQLKPVIQGRSLTLTLTEPRPVTIEVNGNWTGALHLFANPPESDVPRTSDPKTIYFGPAFMRSATWW